MIDQRVREGSNIDFFGNPATTTTIPAQLIKKFSINIVPVYIERINGLNFKIIINDPLNFRKEA